MLHSSLGLASATKEAGGPRIGPPASSSRVDSFALLIIGVESIRSRQQPLSIGESLAPRHCSLERYAICVVQRPDMHCMKGDIKKPASAIESLIGERRPTSWGSDGEWREGTSLHRAIRSQLTPSWYLRRYSGRRPIEHDPSP